MNVLSALWRAAGVPGKMTWMKVIKTAANETIYGH